MIRRPPLLTIFAFVVAALLAGPVYAETPTTSPAVCIPAAAETAPGRMDGVPAPEWLTCSARNECGNGSPVSCTGTSTCTVSSNGVTCDGNYHGCPDLCSVSLNCNCYCGATTSVNCSSNSGDCTVYPNKGVVCDGTLHTCFSVCVQICGGPF